MSKNVNLHWIAIRGCAIVVNPLPMTIEVMGRTCVLVGSRPGDSTGWLTGPDNTHNVHDSNAETILGFATQAERDASYKILLHGKRAEMESEVHRLEQDSTVTIIQPLMGQPEGRMLDEEAWRKYRHLFGSVGTRN